MNAGKRFAAGLVIAGVVGFALLAGWYGRQERASREPATGTPAAAAPAELLVRPHSPVKGSAVAPVTIVEFLDPECEACRAMHPIVEEVLAEYAGRARLVIRYMPLHGNSVLAASALEEAREHGKYEEALELLFENQPAWGDHHDPKPELIAQYLQALGIDAQRLTPEYLIPKHREKVEQDRDDGTRLGVRGTPTFFINGVMLPQLGREPLRRAVQQALAPAS